MAGYKLDRKFFANANQASEVHFDTRSLKEDSDLLIANSLVATNNIIICPDTGTDVVELPSESDSPAKHE